MTSFAKYDKLLSDTFKTNASKAERNFKMGKLFTQFTEEKWEQVRTHPYFAKSVKAITERAEKYLTTPPPQVKFSDIHLYVTTGNRTIFQAVHSNYEDRMETFFFMYYLTKDEKYITALADAIWNICDFEAWTIPAHVSENATLERRHTWLDLCSTIIGFRVAEILYFVGDKLPELVYRRAKNEVRVRVIESYRDYNDFWWMRSENNWSAVCIGATLCAYLYAAEKEEIDAQIPRMIETAKCYLKGFDDEGCCKEGYSYWSYGFSYFCLFASMLRDYTDGEIDMFKDEKVHAIALFQQNAAINEKETVAFSDCPVSFSPPAWLTHFLKHEYDDMETPGFKESPEGTAVLRYILWQDPELADSKLSPKSFIFHDAQWFIHRGAGYTFACKAGANNEPHNHNDVGSFLISKNGKVTFCDPGTGEYTRQYFSAERYNILNTSSRGHSVPIINGEYQVTGSKKSTIFAEAENKYVFSMENGYSIPTLKQITRDVDCRFDKAVLKDSYEFTEKPESVVERFVSYHVPETGEGYVKCGDSVMKFNPAVFELSISDEPIIRSATSKPTLYLIDLKVKNPTEKFEVSVEFI